MKIVAIIPARYKSSRFPGKSLVDISVNPVGLKGLFKDIYTDEYKNSLRNEFTMEEIK